ncbi:MAG TPA: cytochrome c oxidase subunit II [Gemmatimonadaceae bacterium]|nr:cytochrome c oxidase subunit II [Gemmatimonadaceae bacterium]
MTAHRSRRRRAAVLTAVVSLAAAACSHQAPNSIFNAHSDFGQVLDGLTNRLLFLAAIVFVLVEGLLLFVIWRYRARPGNTEAKQLHGNTRLEIAWTLVPAILLALIAVPTVRTIFRTEAPAPANSLRVEVIGHQWWWEFRYPDLGVVTANELYLPVGRTAAFDLKTQDVLHSFWIPQLAGGKRDLITNHTNHLWFTPESTFVWNGFCAEYCGASHANMRFRVFTVSPAQFDQWVAHQKSGPVTVAAATPPAGGASAPAPAAQPAPDTATGTFPVADLPGYIVPNTPLPPGAEVPVTQGDAQRGAQLFRTNACIACHTIQGVSPGVVGPNLTHVGSRTTIGAGLYPNDMRHLEAWIKHSEALKPGSKMPPMGKGLPGAMGQLDDQQIADIAAYLSSLK